MSDLPPGGDAAQAFAAALRRHEAGDLDAAAAAYQAMLALWPAHAEAWHHLGLTHAQCGRIADAEQAIRRALEIAPDLHDAAFNLALVFQQAGRHGDAVALYQRVAAAGANLAALRLNLGNALLITGQAAEAAEAYRRALALDPRSIDAAANLATAAVQLGRYAEGAACYRQALQIDPQRHDLREALAGLDEFRGDIAAALAGRAQAIAAQPSRADLLSEQIVDFEMVDEAARAATTRREWHERFAAPAAVHRRPHPNPPDPERRLKIGFVGGDQLRTHTLGPVLLPLIEAYDRAQFELFAYSDLPPAGEDDISARYRACMTWRRTHGFSDEQFANAIASDGIDILIDPVAFTLGSRLLALARRPAPVQVSFPTMGSCGGDTIDYVVADAVLVPENSRAMLSEKVLTVPFPYCYRPSVAASPVQDPPAIAAGYVTFGSFNNLLKLSPGLLRAWARILGRVERSRLLVKAGAPFRDESVRGEFLGRLVAAGVDPQRVTLAPWTKELRNHLDVYNTIDIALDSFPYCGVTTTFETLSAGAPVVTRAGVRIMERYGASILTAVGFGEGIARDDDDYVERAVRLAGDVARLRDLRRTLPRSLAGSIACDPGRVMAGLEAGLRAAWRDWCARISP